MEKTKKTLDDLTAELEGAAELLYVMSGAFLEGAGGYPTHSTTSAALFGMGRYVERIKDDIDALNETAGPLRPN